MKNVLHGELSADTLKTVWTALNFIELNLTQWKISIHVNLVISDSTPKSQQSRAEKMRSLLLDESADVIFDIFGNGLMIQKTGIVMPRLEI